MVEYGLQNPTPQNPPIFSTLKIQNITIYSLLTHFKPLITQIHILTLKTINMTNIHFPEFEKVLFFDNLLQDALELNAYNIAFLIILMDQNKITHDRFVVHKLTEDGIKSYYLFNKDKQVNKQLIQHLLTQITDIHTILTKHL